MRLLGLMLMCAVFAAPVAFANWETDFQDAVLKNSNLKDKDERGFIFSMTKVSDLAAAIDVAVEHRNVIKGKWDKAFFGLVGKTCTVTLTKTNDKLSIKVEFEGDEKAAEMNNTLEMPLADTVRISQTEVASNLDGGPGATDLFYEVRPDGASKDTLEINTFPRFPKVMGIEIVTKDNRETCEFKP